ncbi:MAG: hypothetical protein E7Y34_01075, partial [Mycoplasma sp.]|nr:hypothetical protein [Mycoplasma sp.]
MKKINLKDGTTLGPYSHGVLANNMLFVSGQLGIDSNNQLPECVQEQTKNSLENIEKILKEASFTKEDIVKCTIFVKDLNHFSLVNETYAAFFGEHKPARACVEVARLPRDGKVEI